MLKTRILTVPARSTGWTNEDGSGDWYFGEITLDNIEYGNTCTDCGHVFALGESVAYDADAEIRVCEGHISVRGE